MERRTALKIVALSALAPGVEFSHQPAGARGILWAADSYRLRFFTAEENQLLDQLMETVIPEEAHSPGAHAAQVSLFADLMVATSDDPTKAQWRQGLRLMREEAARSSLEEALAKAASHEEDPQNELERFFVSLKHMTVNGYYTSAIGIHQDLQYRGNTYLAVFPGCKSPAMMNQGNDSTPKDQAESGGHAG